VTLWAWMSQVLDPDKSLSHTVARVIAWLSESGQLCRLRTLALIAKPKRLPLSVIQRLAQTAQTLSVQISDEQRWWAAESAPMMAHNGDAIPRQPGLSSARQSEAGCGFPLAKLVVLFCVTTEPCWRCRLRRLRSVNGRCPANLRPSPTGGCGCGRFCLRHLRGLGISTSC